MQDAARPAMTAMTHMKHTTAMTAMTATTATTAMTALAEDSHNESDSDRGAGQKLQLPLEPRQLCC